MPLLCIHMGSMQHTRNCPSPATPAAWSWFMKAACISGLPEPDQLQETYGRGEHHVQHGCSESTGVSGSLGHPPIMDSKASTSGLPGGWGTTAGSPPYQAAPDHIVGSTTCTLNAIPTQPLGNAIPIVATQSMQAGRACCWFKGQWGLCQQGPSEEALPLLKGE